MAGDRTTQVFDGLTADTAYQFTVTASTANGTGPESTKSDSVVVLGTFVASAGVDQSITRAATPATVVIDGSASTSADTTYRWEQVLSGPTDPDRVTLVGATTVKPTFSLPLFAPPMTNNPLTFKLTVTSGPVERTDEVRITPIASQISVTGVTYRLRTSLSNPGSIWLDSTLGGMTGPVTVTAG